MIVSILSHFRGDPLCVGCEEHRVVRDYLCQHCLEKVEELDRKRDYSRKSCTLHLV
jgi:SUMO ligase MMS21 Smc5/6 complex component